jgi:hypothetical protein
MDRLNNKSCMSREAHVQFCEGVRGKFPRSTRLVITGDSKEFLEHEIKPVIESFLKDRGLNLSEEKTRITHIDEGFDFLGKNIRKYIW